MYCLPMGARKSGIERMHNGKPNQAVVCYFSRTVCQLPDGNEMPSEAEFPLGLAAGEAGENKKSLTKGQAFI